MGTSMSTADDRAAAVTVGNQRNHLLTITS